MPAPDLLDRADQLPDESPADADYCAVPRQLERLITGAELVI